VKNVIAGAFNSASKITGAVGNGVSYITLDDAYLEDREREKVRKAKNVFKGLYIGGKQIYLGFEEGITGLFTRPYQGAKADGWTGFFKGTYKGIAGLVLKPTTGVLDAVSKTSEGIKNTATFFDEKPHDYKYRFPRAFYAEEKFIRIYFSSDAELMFHLEKHHDGKYAKKSLLHAYELYADSENQVDGVIFGLCVEGACAWDVQKKKLVFFVDYENIAKVEENEKGIEIALKNPWEQKLKELSVKVESGNKKMNEYVVKIVKELLETQKDN